MSTRTLEQREKRRRAALRRADRMTRNSPWQLSWRADPVARVIADRHYNRQKPGSPQFVPPGACLVMRTVSGDALWVTSAPIAEYVQHAWAGAWMNSLFRNEGPLPAHQMIRAAVAHTRAKWLQVPDLGMVTFVDPGQVRGKQDPGFCYILAGFRHVGSTKGGLLAFQLTPDRMPDPVPVPGSQSSLFDLEAS